MCCKKGCTVVIQIPDEEFANEESDAPNLHRPIRCRYRNLKSRGRGRPEFHSSLAPPQHVSQDGRPSDAGLSDDSGDYQAVADETGIAKEVERRYEAPRSRKPGREKTL
jgi:hypothetical protein